MNLHPTRAFLDAGMQEILMAPKDQGSLERIYCRPDVGLRQSLERAELSMAQGLVGDNWYKRALHKNPELEPNPELQLTLMNLRALRRIAGDPSRWELAGDQLLVDLDLSRANLPPGSQLKIGSALLEVSAIPHTGCKKFVTRFGIEAMKWVNDPEGRANNLRGIHARILQAGSIRRHDLCLKVK